MKRTKVSQSKKDLNAYPPGWNLQKTRVIADYYDRRKDQPVAESSSVARSEMAVWMEIPPEFVDQVRRLIARRRKTA